VGRVLGQRSIRQRVRQAVRRCEGESSRQGGQPSFDEPPQQQRWKKGTQDKPDPSDAGFNPACIQLCIINIILAQTNATHDPISCVSASGRSNLTQGAASPTRADRQVVIFTTSRQHAPHLKCGSSGQHKSASQTASRISVHSFLQGTLVWPPTDRQTYA